MLQVATEVGYYDNAVLLFFRQLAFHLKGTEAVNFVAKEINTVGVFGREREDIDEAAAHGKLAGFVDIVHVFEAIAAQHVGNECHVYPFSAMQFQGFVFQFHFRHYFFGQCVGVSDDAQLLAVLLQAAQYLGAQYFVGGILLPVFDGTAERGGEEEHLLRAQCLAEVVIEVAGFFQVAQNEERTALRFCKQ